MGQSVYGDMITRIGQKIILYGFGPAELLSHVMRQHWWKRSGIVVYLDGYLERFCIDPYALMKCWFEAVRGWERRNVAQMISLRVWDEFSSDSCGE